MNKFLKNNFPNMYIFLKHYRQLYIIHQIETLKKLDKREYKNILSKAYKKYIGRELDWNNLQTYTEKMQWAKLYDSNMIKAQLADKYLVREWVKNKIGAEYLIPLLGSWDKFDDIDFSYLPNEFVLKTNHGTGTNVIVKDKKNLNLKHLKILVDDWMNTDYGYTNFFQLHYSMIKRKIIVEKFMATEGHELQDYKFLCFSGKPIYCWVDSERYTNHTRNVYDMNWNLQPWTQARYSNFKYPIPKPSNFDKMVNIATILSEGFSHVRVDLYNINGKIYFGEMTFTNGSGLDPIIPDCYDYNLGSYWSI